MPPLTAEQKRLVALFENAPDLDEAWAGLTAAQQALLEEALAAQDAVQQDAVPPASPHALPQPKKRDKRRTRWRETELKVFSRYSAEAIGKRMTANALSLIFPNRDIYNPNDITGPVIGNTLDLSASQIMNFERLARDYAHKRGWNDGFSFRTITCRDRERDLLKRLRRERANIRIADKRRVERAQNREIKMQTEMTQTQSKSKYASVRDAVTANIRARDDAIDKALGDSKRSITQVMDAVWRHPAWRALAKNPKSFRRVMSDRLNAMRDAGRIVDDYEPRPNGYERIVWRA